MNDPIAFFITWPTYGTWLPGDERGWVEYKRGWKLPSECRQLEAKTTMREDACKLDAIARGTVERQVQETCEFRGWISHAVNCRSNHMHVVIGAIDTDPMKIRSDLKAWCTRRLKEKVDPCRQNWWAERGSIRWIFNEDSLHTVVQYVMEAQNRKERDQS